MSLLVLRLEYPSCYVNLSGVPAYIGRRFFSRETTRAVISRSKIFSLSQHKLPL